MFYNLNEYAYNVDFAAANKHIWTKAVYIWCFSWISVRKILTLGVITWEKAFLTGFGSFWRNGQKTVEQKVPKVFFA